MKVIDSAKIYTPNGSIECEIAEYEKLEGQTNSLDAQKMWFMEQQGIKCRQIQFNLDNSMIKLEPGALSYMQGDIQMTSGIDLGSLFKKIIRGTLTGEQITFPEYRGTGKVVLEPSFKFFTILELEPGERVVCDKGMFYCAQGDVGIRPYLIRNLSGAVLGGEGMFQTELAGPGLVVLECPVPMSEVKVIHLNNDTLKVDGNFALLRTGNIEMTVERSSKTLTGSAMSGEGLLNVFRGTGDVWIAPSLKVYQAISLQDYYGGSLTKVNMNTQTGNAR